jgi:hypothetical protein
MNESNQTPNTPEAEAPVPSAQPDEASKRAFAPQPERKPAEAVENKEQKSEDAAAADSKNSAARVKKSDTPSSAASELEAGTVVLMSKLVFESFEHRSASVSVLQTRLMELGYATAGDDKHGWLSAGTKEALQKFATDNGLEAKSFLDEKVMKAVFANTKVTILS